MRPPCMRMMIVALVLAAGLPAARGQGMWDLIERGLKEDAPRSGAALLRRCDSADPGDRAYCFGTLTAMSMEGRSRPDWRCVPPEAAREEEQLRILFVREAYRSPETLHLPAEPLLFSAVAKAFPCPTKR